VTPPIAAAICTDQRGIDERTDVKNVAKTDAKTGARSIATIVASQPDAS
jgi:hypothetical protein